MLMDAAHATSQEDQADCGSMRERRSGGGLLVGSRSSRRTPSLSLRRRFGKELCRCRLKARSLNIHGQGEAGRTGKIEVDRAPLSGMLAGGSQLLKSGDGGFRGKSGAHRLGSQWKTSNRVA